MSPTHGLYPEFHNPETLIPDTLNLGRNPETIIPESRKDPNPETENQKFSKNSRGAGGGSPLTTNKTLDTQSRGAGAGRQPPDYLTSRGRGAAPPC